jgi:hypothetical protein
VGLPPDLARLGNDLVDAARRTTRARRERRRRAAISMVAGALAFAALTPAALEPAHRGLTSADALAQRCDHLPGPRATLARCEGPMVLYRPYAIN